MATAPPAAGDNLLFSGQGVPGHGVGGTDGVGGSGGGGSTNTSSNCYGMVAASGGAYNSVTLDSTYTATVTVTGAFSTNSLTMAGGTIDQPYSGTDITVTSGFSWTGGTLNSTSNVANLILSGATATIAPTSAGTVNLGDNISLVNGTVATFSAGILNSTNANTQVNIGENCGMNVDPGWEKKRRSIPRTSTPTQP